MDDLIGREALIKGSGLKKGRILDIGIGDCGCMAFFLARRGFHVIGIDHSPIAVHGSRESAKRSKFKGSFQAKLADAGYLPFKDDEFDAVSSYHSMHHLDDARKAIKEMFRVCKSRGFVLVADLNEEGRKKYDHELDNGRFLKRVERYLDSCAASIRKVETKYTTLFICKK
jgi:ubiquinone/menaquinone biosynthesis C-methylase UbiE